MRIAIPTEDNNKEAPLSPRFGRCDYYCIYDSETLAISFLPNPFTKEPAAGNKAAKMLLEQNIDFVVTSEIGDIAQKTLHNFRIRTFQSKENKSIIDQIYGFMEKDLAVLDKSTKENKQNHEYHNFHHNVN